MAVDRTRMEAQVEQGDANARVVVSLLERVSFVLSSAQLGISIMGIVLGFLSKPVFGAIIEPVLDPVIGESASAGVSVVLAIVLSTAFIMVVGELVPKSAAISRPETTTRLLGRPMVVWNAVMYPFVKAFDSTANWIVRRLGVEPREELDHKPDIDELEALIISSGEEGALDPDDVVLLKRAIRFQEKTAADALTPRVNVVALNTDDTVGELKRLAIESGFSRFPVTDGSLDDVVGIVHVKSIYTLPAADRADRPVMDIMNTMLAVPESRDLDDLFGDLRENRNHLAVVVDEHGGTAGIITLEDLLEEIVGEIDDEFDSGAAELSRVDAPGNFVLSAALHPDEVEEACGFAMPEGPFETLAGFVLHELGYIPKKPGGLFAHNGWRVEVFAVEGLRVSRVRLAEPGAWSGVGSGSAASRSGSGSGAS